MKKFIPRHRQMSLLHCTSIHVKSAEANGNGNGEVIHLARNVHATRCGLSRSFQLGAIITDNADEVTCANCKRAQATLNLLRRRSSKLEHYRPAGTDWPTNGERPGLVEVRFAFEAAERVAAERLGA